MLFIIASLQNNYFKRKYSILQNTTDKDPSETTLFYTILAILILILIWLVLFLCVFTLYFNLLKYIVMWLRYPLYRFMWWWFLLLLLITPFYIFLFSTELFSFYNELYLKGSNIFQYRVINKEIIYPVDIFYHFRFIKFKLPNKYQIVAFILTTGFVGAFIFYLLTAYIFFYWLVLFSYIFIYTNYILYNICLKKNARIQFDAVSPSMIDRGLYQTLSFLLFESPRVRSLLVIYILISPKQKSRELIPLLKRLILNRILIAPLWTLDLWYFIYSILTISLSSLNWNEKLAWCYPTIFWYDFCLRLGPHLAYRLAFFIETINQRSIFIEKGKLRTNSLIDRIVGSFLVKTTKAEPSFNEWVSNITRVTHRVAPVQLIDPYSSNLILARSYTTTPSIRLLTPIKTTQRVSTGTKNFECNFDTTPTAHPTQYMFGTVLPAKNVLSSTLTTFFRAHNLSNPFRYKLFKICENASLVAYAQTVVDNPDDPSVILYQEPQIAIPSSYNKLKKNCKVDAESIAFLEEDAPRLADDLKAFVFASCSHAEIEKFDLDWITAAVQKKLLDLTFDHNRRNDLFLTHLAIDSELNNDVKAEIVRLLKDKNNVKWPTSF